jgi:hypothetical protein
MDHSSPRIPSNQRAAGKLSKIIDVHSHAILSIGEQVPLANQARWSVEGALTPNWVNPQVSRPPYGEPYANTRLSNFTRIAKRT